MWEFVGMVDMGEQMVLCQLCQTHKIRYVHHMRQDGQSLDVGCDCAGKLLGDPTRSRAYQTEFKEAAHYRDRGDTCHCPICRRFQLMKADFQWKWRYHAGTRRMYYSQLYLLNPRKAAQHEIEDMLARFRKEHPPEPGDGAWRHIMNPYPEHVAEIAEFVAHHRSLLEEMALERARNGVALTGISCAARAILGLMNKPQTVDARREWEKQKAFEWHMRQMLDATDPAMLRNDHR